ncbi:hypothetical protein [Cobetia sp. L2A1]|uniref:hypothetical protein n=1 Tax=Cobetia sp. L2A1 TaxID=2686360 RepID=UPI00131BC120|nr:hypothetical protein [Cobetia sp. L2A1]
MELWFALEDSWLGMWVASSEWGYPITLSLHVVGMAMVLGISWMIDLRVLGINTAASITGLLRYRGIVLLGAFISLLTGIGMFAGEASMVYDNTALWAKLLVLPFALGTSLWLWRRLRPEARAIRPADKGLALVNLLLWGAAMLAGRLIGYCS